MVDVGVEIDLHISHALFFRLKPLGWKLRRLSSNKKREIYQNGCIDPCSPYYLFLFFQPQ